MPDLMNVCVCCGDIDGSQTKAFSPCFSSQSHHFSVGMFGRYVACLYSIYSGAEDLVIKCLCSLLPLVKTDSGPAASLLQRWDDTQVQEM